MIAPKHLAKIAGLLYLFNGAFSGFEYGYVLSKVYFPGDATTTAENLRAHAGLFRLGVMADLLQATIFVFLGMTLYLLLKHVRENVAKAMVLLVGIGATIMSLNAIFEFASLLVATDSSYIDSFGTAGANSLVMLLLDMQHYGFLIAQIFFGLWLMPLGYLAYKSGMFPKTLCVLLNLAAISYLLDMFFLFLTPSFGETINPFLVIVPIVAEVWMVFSLLFIGFKRSVEFKSALNVGKNDQ